MKKFSIGNKTIIAVEVPEGASDFSIGRNTACVTYVEKGDGTKIDDIGERPLPDGEYKVLGRAGELTNEKQCYLMGKKPVNRISLKVADDEEFQSLMEIYEITPNTLLIEKIA